METKLQRQLEEILKAAIAPAAERIAALETRLRKVEEGEIAASVENRVKVDRHALARVIHHCTRKRTIQSQTYNAMDRVPPRSRASGK